LNSATLLSKGSPLLRDRAIAGVFPMQEALALFDALAVLDESNDRRRQRLRKLTIAGIGASLVAPFVGLPIACILTIPATVVLAIRTYRLGRVDIPNDVRLFVLPWLRLLSADMDATETVSLKVDLRACTDKRHRVADEVASGRKWETYHHPWFSGEATLTDGARLQWSAVTHLRKHTTWKKKGRSKIKIKQAMKYDVALGLPSSSFAVDPVAKSGIEKIRVKPGEKRTVVRVSYVAHSASLAPANVDDLVSTVASAYRQGTPQASEQSA
jgi:hypothetical protein